MATWPMTPKEYAALETAIENVGHVTEDDPQYREYMAETFSLYLQRQRRLSSSKPEPRAQLKAQQEGRANFALGLAVGLMVGSFVVLSLV